MQIAANQDMEPSNRQLAVEFLVTLCEARDKAPGMMRRIPQFADHLFETLLNFLIDIEVCQ